MSEQDTDPYTASREANESFNAKVAEFEQHAAQQPAPAEPNAAALEAVNAAHRATDGSGRRQYENDSDYRARVEAARVAAFEGKTPAQVQKILAGNDVPATPQTPATPAEPQGDPVDRLVQRLESGDVVSRDELTPELWEHATAGYRVDLPEGYGLTADDAADLAAARKAGLTQRQIDALIADRVRS